MVAGDRTWALKGVRDGTRDAVRETAHEAGLAVGDWVDRALAKAVAEARHPRPPAATREEVAEAVRGLLDERLAPLVETLKGLAGRLASLEEAVGRQARPEQEPADEVAGGVTSTSAPTPTSVEAVRARLHRRRRL
jgi:hypothetical protein